MRMLQNNFELVKCSIYEASGPLTKSVLQIVPLSPAGEDAARRPIPHRRDYFDLFEPPVNALVVVDLHLHRQEPLSDIQQFIGMIKSIRYGIAIGDGNPPIIIR